MRKQHGLPHLKKHLLSVYCVERNRWGYNENRNFEKSAQKMGPKARQVKVNRTTLKFKRAQFSSVWDEVGSGLTNLQATTAPRFDASLARRLKKKILRKFVESDCHGYRSPGQRRFVELFWHEAVCRKQVLKSVRSWLADAAMERTAVALSQTSLKSELQIRLGEAKAIAAEQPLDNQNLSGGRLTLLEDGFLHSYIAL